MSDTHPKIRESMKRDRERAALRNIITTSTDTDMTLPAERRFRIMRALLPARFRR